MFDMKSLLAPLVPAKAPARSAKPFTKDDAARMLDVTPEALDAFEASYRTNVLDMLPEDADVFHVNAKQASEMAKAKAPDVSLAEADSLIDAIVEELLAQTRVLEYDGKSMSVKTFDAVGPAPAPVTPDVINRLPAELRPQLTGIHAMRDIEAPTGLTVLSMYKNYLEAKEPKSRNMYYGMFRQGLDILDLDPLTYEIIGRNMNSMGHWLPALAAAVGKQDFFRVPATKVLKIPVTLLQLTRMDYAGLTPSTKAVVDRFCFRAFGLDESRDYFIKTGTYSSKFDFRNAHVHGAKEVRELGEYLLFIHFQACQMASPLAEPRIFGVSTTNEWVVRDYIPDTQGLPCIYKGLPLRTEYRVFVDFDTDEILGANPYWDPTVMLDRFGSQADAGDPHQMHDYVIYKNQADRLAETYARNIETVKARVAAMLPDIDLPGQWSVDVMQDGDDFYVIDMALAANSALSGCVPKGKLRPATEDWLPEIPKGG